MRKKSSGFPGVHSSHPITTISTWLSNLQLLKEKGIIFNTVLNRTSHHGQIIIYFLIFLFLQYIKSASGVSSTHRVYFTSCKTGKIVKVYLLCAVVSKDDCVRKCGLIAWWSDGITPRFTSLPLFLVIFTFIKYFHGTSFRS